MPCRSWAWWGVIADPGLPHELVRRVSAEMAGDGDDPAWRFDVRNEAIPLDPGGRIRVRKLARTRMDAEGWDYLICLTDLPRQDGTRPVVADLDTERRVALVSLPAIGGFRLRARVRDVFGYLLGVLAGHRPAEPTGPFSGLKPLPTGDTDTDLMLALPNLRSRLRLLAGMVRANRPWRLVPSLSRAIAAAAATAAFGVFFPTIWSLADALSIGRLAVISLFAVAAMVTWLILHNGLWERPLGAADRGQAVLYNASSVLTLFVGVACMYVLLFSITLVGAVAVISSDYLATSLKHPAGFGDYLVVVWLASSMGTVAGALGSSLETEEAIRQAAYSKRERERRAQRRDEEEEEAEPDPAGS